LEYAAKQLENNWHFIQRYDIKFEDQLIRDWPAPDNYERKKKALKPDFNRSIKGRGS